MSRVQAGNVPGMHSVMNKLCGFIILLFAGLYHCCCFFF